jgi:cytochrome c-type biogenesis protein CcmF
MALVGSAALYLTLILAVWAGALAVVGARRRQAPLIDGAVAAVYAVAAAATLAMLAMIYGFVVSDFSLTYVAGHSDRAMPLFYRITGVWGGMEGSLLLWLWLQSLVAAAAVRVNRRRLPELLPYAIAVLMVIVVFFAVLLVVHSDPFARFLLEVPTLGKGLNPLLQNPYMVTHPPSLYIGFVGLSVPFALAIGALLSGQLDDSWIHASRPWALLAWFFLSLGLTLGMLWAYEELGWGGYWGWDPVENAGFMPWLLVTAYLHSIMVQERRQMLKRWNMLLATLGFVMTIFGTFLTRSGFIESVHAFAKSDIGYVFLAFIAVTLIVASSLLYYRRAALRSRAELESVFSREFWFLLNNWVLLSACVLVLVLTTFPNLSVLFGEKVTISIPAFNRWMVPVGIVLLLVTGIGPMLGWRKTSEGSLRRQFLWPLVTGLGTAAGLAALGARSNNALLAWGLSAFVLATIAQEIIRATLLRAQAAGISLLRAFGGLFAKNRRRYGGYIVHVGIVVMCIGFAGEAFKLEKEVLMKPGQRFAIGRYIVRSEGLRVTRDKQKQMITAPLTVFVDGEAVALMHPARWIYDRKKDQPTTEVSIKRSMAEDLYVAVGNFDAGKQIVTFKLVINPLVNWIWLGFLVMTFGVVLAGMPLPTPRRRGATALLLLLLPAAALLGAPGMARAGPPPSKGSKAALAGQGHSAAAKPLHQGHQQVDGPVLLTSDGPRERKIFSSISCMCGGCPKIPLESCNCGFAQRERGAIRAKLRAGWNDKRIYSWYTRQRGSEIGREPFGAQALAEPPDTAFNRLAWLLPYGLSVFSVCLLVLVGLRWKRNRLPTTGAGAAMKAKAPDGTSSRGDDAYAALLDDELRKLD